MNGAEGVAVLGGGLAGLAAAQALARAGVPVSVLEREAGVGGLARTVVRGDYRFDLGGHRLFTTDPRLEAFLKDLLGPELLVVPRRSRIRLWRKDFDYPLTPVNALFGLGPGTALRILRDYAAERLRVGRAPECVSLEDWVVRGFGRTLFEIYFKVYSEKVWGIPSERISAGWVAQRIRGLSLATALRAAFVRFGGREIPTLADRFLYPSAGIGRVAEALAARLGERGRVLTEARVEALHHAGGRIEAAAVRHRGRRFALPARAFVSTLPITALVRMLRPRPPAEVLEAAAGLRYRDLVIVAVMIDRPRVTDLSWLYLPEPEIPFARIHEPTNWSPRMAPAGRTLLVAEHFCFRGDATWRAGDADLAAATVHHLERLGLIRGSEVLDAAVVRVPRAYPLFEVGSEARAAALRRYLEGFGNLQLAGRGGSFRYLNMDHALEAGLQAAGRILAAGEAGAGGRRAPAREGTA